MSARLLSAITSIAGLAMGLQTQAIAATVVSGDYYEQTSQFHTCNTNTNFCRLNLQPIPADKFLDVRRINCNVRTTQPLIEFVMGSGVASGASSGRNKYYPFDAPVTAGNTHYYYIDREVEYRVGASPYLFFTATISAAGNISLSCSVTGKLSPK